MNSPRNKTVDIARGIAMIAIVLGHLGIANINRVVFTFHLPIFYLITGYFMNTQKNTAEIIKKRFRTLIVPYFIACAGVIIAAALVNIFSGGILSNTAQKRALLFVQYAQSKFPYNRLSITLLTLWWV